MANDDRSHPDSLGEPIHKRLFDAELRRIKEAREADARLADERYATQNEELKTAFAAADRALTTALAAAEKALEQRAATLDREFHEHLEQVRHENALAFSNSDKAVQAALASAKEAVNKAEAAAERRFEGVNEFRATLSDQALSFIPRKEVEVMVGRNTQDISELKDTHNREIGELRETLNREMRDVRGQLDKKAGADTGKQASTTESRSNVVMLVGIVGLLLAVAVAVFK